MATSTSNGCVTWTCKTIPKTTLPQNDIGNQVSALTIVAAITTNLRVADLPVGVRIEPQESGLPRPSVVHLGHIYTVDKRRLGRRAGQLPAEVMRQINAAVQVSLGLQTFEL